MGIEVESGDLSSTLPQLRQRAQEALSAVGDVIDRELARTSGSDRMTERPLQSATQAEAQVASPPSAERLATPAQVKAIHAIAKRAGIELSQALQKRYGVAVPARLTLRQASQLIDQLKLSLTSSPA